MAPYLDLIPRNGGGEEAGEISEHMMTDIVLGAFGGIALLAFLIGLVYYFVIKPLKTKWAARKVAKQQRQQQENVEMAPQRRQHEEV